MYYLKIYTEFLQQIQVGSNDSLH